MSTLFLAGFLTLQVTASEPTACEEPQLFIAVHAQQANYRVECPGQTPGFILPSVPNETRPETLPRALPTAAKVVHSVDSTYSDEIEIEIHQTNRFIDGVRPRLAIPVQSNRYRTWHYQLRIPPGWVGFIGNQTFDRSPRERVVRGVFRDRYVPFFLGTSLRSFIVDHSLLILHPRVAEHPLRFGKSTIDIFRDTAREILESQRGSKSEAPIIVIGHEGSAIAFDHPSGAFWHERMVEGDPSPIHWQSQRQESARRSLVRFSLTSRKRHRLRTERDRQRIEWDAEMLLRNSDLTARTDLERLEAIAVIPEIDQFLADPQVPFSGALGRFQNGTRRGHDDTPWGWQRKRPDGDWLWTIGQAFVQTGQPSFDDCASVQSLAETPCQQWSTYPLPALDLVLDLTNIKATSVEAVLEVVPSESRRLLPEQIEVVTTKGTRVPFTLGVSKILDPEDLPIRIAKHHAQFELPTKERPFPHFNNQTDKPWRWMLNSVFGLFGAVGGNFTVAAQFAGRPLYASSPKLYPSIVLGSSYMGGGFSSSWNFGQYTQALSRAHNLGAGIIAAATDDETSGWLPTISLWTGYRWSTRITQWDFLRGSGFSTRLETGASRRDAIRPFLSVGVGALSVVPISDATSLALRLRYNTISGPDQETLGFALGSRDRGVRGISLGLFKVPERWLGTLELRSVLGRGYQDLLGLVGLTQLRGTLFTDIAYLADKGMHDRCPSWVGSSGIGLQWLGDMVGIAPGALTLDIGIPIQSCNDTKWELYLGFVPPLVAF